MLMRNIFAVDVALDVGSAPESEVGRRIVALADTSCKFAQLDSLTRTCAQYFAKMKRKPVYEARLIEFDRRSTHSRCDIRTGLASQSPKFGNFSRWSDRTWWLA